MKKKYKKIVVKVGSNVLTREDGTLDVARISSLVDQISQLCKAGIEVIMVSSGAVASGRSELGAKVGKMDSVSARQLFSAVGQAKLINHYYDMFRSHGIACGQVLTTKESLSTRTHYLNQRNCMSVMLANGVIPIVNENDTISVTELMFTDNDELSGILATMMDAEALVILSNVDGICNGTPGEDGVEVIREIRGSGDDITNYIRTGFSKFGRGGMLTKSRIARKVAGEGVEVIIANGKRDDILTDLILSDKDTLSTRFVPAPKPLSGVKKWIAHSEDFANGELHINECTYRVLTGPKAVSLLPVGVVEVVGSFEKGDIVHIVAPDGEYIGVGRVAVDSERAREIAGTKGAKPLVHYDYMYLD